MSIYTYDNGQLNPVVKIDTAPTANSTNAVSSGGVKSALDGKAPTNHASTSTTYGVASETNYGHVKIVDYVSMGSTEAITSNAVHNEIYGPRKIDTRLSMLETMQPKITASLSNIISNINNNGSKNILPFDIEHIYENNTEGTWTTSTNTFIREGVSYAIQDDGTIIVNREEASSNTSAFNYYNTTNGYSIPAGVYHFSGLPSTGSSSTFRLRYALYYADGTNTGWRYISEADGGDITINDGCVGLKFGIMVYSGGSPSNQIWKPMICLETDWELTPTYVPYAKSNKQLTEENQEISAKNQAISTALSNHERQNAKNMCVNNILKGMSYRGLTFTPHEDGSITINGTSTGAAYIDITRQIPVEGFASSLKKYSCEELGLDITKPVFQSTGNDSVTTGTGISLRLYCYESEEATSALGYFGSGNSSVKTIAEVYPTTKYISFSLGASEGHTANNVTVYPILYYNSELDKSYVPYAKSNRQLAKDANYLVDNTKFNGAVNMCKNNATTQIINGITFTVNDDGTVTADGTATANADLDLNPGFIEKANVLYRLSGGPSGGSQSTWLLYERNSPNALDTGDGVLFSRTEDVTASVRIRIYAGQTVSNLIFKPMISVASYSGDYVPYAKSNKELTKDIDTMNEIYSDNTIPTSLDSNISISRWYRKRIGRIVQLSLTFTATASNSNQVQLCTLESQAYPLMQTSQNIPPAGIVPANSAGAFILISTDGKVHTKYVEAGGIYNATITYISKT